MSDRTQKSHFAKQQLIELLWTIVSSFILLLRLFVAFAYYVINNNNNNNNYYYYYNDNATHKFLWVFNIQTDHLIPARRPDLIIINKKKKKEKKKRTCKIVDFAVPADHRIKLKECEKRDKYLDLARELKKLWNMQVTSIPIVIGAFGTVTK